MSSVSAQTNTTGPWASLGAMPAPVWNGKTLLFHSGQGTLAISALSDDVIRVRFITARLDFC